LDAVYESLPCAIRAVARRAGLVIGHDALLCAMGLTWAPCANEDGVEFWPAYARDGALIEAGRLFGLDIRPVHPPETARGLEAAPEFGQHFDASYRPFVCRALENHQPVLAWRGWGASLDRAWGLIHAAAADGASFDGAVYSQVGDRLVENTAVTFAPPTQLYVVERVLTASPSTIELIEFSLAVARRTLRGEWGGRFGVAMGPAAIDAWRQRWRTDAGVPNRLAAHGSLAQHLIQMLDCGVRVLRRSLARLAPVTRSVVEAFLGATREFTAALTLFCASLKMLEPTRGAAAMSALETAEAATRRMLGTLSGGR
jgi:hypothetical protein